MSDLERARAACFADPAATAAQLAAGGLPPPVAERMAGVVGDTLAPSRAGIELLLAQRRRLGLPGGDDGYVLLVDMRRLSAVSTKERSE